MSFERWLMLADYTCGKQYALPLSREFGITICGKEFKLFDITRIKVDANAVMFPLQIGKPHKDEKKNIVFVLVMQEPSSEQLDRFYRMHEGVKEIRANFDSASDTLALHHADVTTPLSIY